MAGFKCQFCEKTYRYEKKLMRHVKTVHAKSLDHQCLNCGIILSSDAKLLQHSKGGKCANKRKRNVSKVYICGQCDETFNTKTCLKKHVSETHSKKQVKEKLQSRSVYFESDSDFDKCLHERVGSGDDYSHTQQPGAAEVKETWR